MWDKFHKTWIYCVLALLAGCAMGGKKSGAEDIIETAGESGCHIKSIKFGDDGKIEQIDCHDTVRYVR